MASDICLKLPATTHPFATSSTPTPAPSSSTATPVPTPALTTTPTVVCLPGKFIANLTTNPVTCVDCKYGAEYQCGEGNFLNGSVCDVIGFNDTQTCETCITLRFRVPVYNSSNFHNQTHNNIEHDPRSTRGPRDLRGWSLSWKHDI
mmetsp:Transcript_37263/g.54669  ORF Transcript_37263/g.54669 Transcript_37263/m.54669 type:complete len:147 (+) Transcript_37263:599-1039(+)